MILHLSVVQPGGCAEERPGLTLPPWTLLRSTPRLAYQDAHPETTACQVDPQARVLDTGGQPVVLLGPSHKVPGARGGSELTRN